MKYFNELKRTMTWLGEQEDTIFVGQGVIDGGTFMSGTFEDVSLHKKVEFPVCEQFQLGYSIGMAMGGLTCITCFPRHNFILLAMAELVNLLDKLPEISGGYFPKVIIRTAVGTTRPIFPGIQHAGDFTEAFRKLLTAVEVIELKEPEDIFPAYKHAYTKNGATLITEFGDFYNEK